MPQTTKKITKKTTLEKLNLTRVKLATAKDRIKELETELDNANKTISELQASTQPTTVPTVTQTAQPANRGIKIPHKHVVGALVALCVLGLLVVWLSVALHSTVNRLDKFQDGWHADKEQILHNQGRIALAVDSLGQLQPRNRQPARLLPGVVDTMSRMRTTQELDYHFGVRDTVP